MQPTPASNETRLPRAVLRRSQAIADRYAPQPEPGAPNPADLAAPANAPAAANAPPADPQPTAPAADPRDSDPAYWKQRFQVTSGILTRERADRTSQVESLHQKVADLEGQLFGLQVQVKSTEKVDIATFFTPDQIEKYGEEQCEVMAATAMRAAETTAKKLVDAAVQPLKAKQERTAASDATAARSTFEEKLTELYPNWPTVDKDSRWLAWLAAEDENEVVRQTYLDTHISTGNARAVANLFKAWEKTAEAAPAPVPPRVPPLSPSGSGATPPGETTPPAASAESVTAPTAAEVKDFYKRSSLGKVRDEERVRFEARLKLRHGAR
jgi:hypothetical protein